MKILILTQHRENYGAHDWDGTGQCPQHWKSKGGNVYVIDKLDVDAAVRLTTSFGELVAPFVTSSDEYFVESVINFELLDDCDSLKIDDWETPIYMVWDEKLKGFQCSEQYTAPCSSWMSKVVRTWFVGENGEKEGMKSEFYDLAGKPCKPYTYHEWVAAQSQKSA